MKKVLLVIASLSMLAIGLTGCPGTGTAANPSTAAK